MNDTQSVNGTPAVEEAPLSFRYSLARRRMLEEIGKELGHPDLSTTLRDAADDYIANHLTRPRASAVTAVAS